MKWKILDIKNLGGPYTSQTCLRTALLIGGGMGDVSTKTVSFKKLSGMDQENTRFRKLEKVDLELIFVPKTG